MRTCITWYESCFFPENAWFSRKTCQAFPFSQKFREFGNWGKWNGKCPRKLSENLKIIEFSKYVNEPVNQKFWKFQEQDLMEQKFPVRNHRKFGYNSPGCPLLRKGKCCPICHWKFQTRIPSRLESGKNQKITRLRYNFWFKLLLNLTMLLQNEVNLKKYLCCKVHMAV